MNTALYYFSGTGNSLSIAQTLNKCIEKSELHPIIGCLKQNRLEITAQRVGLIFPMQFMSVPHIVSQFLKEIQLHNTKYLFVIITGANPKLGNALSEIKKHFNNKNLTLNSGYFIPMVASHFPYLKLSKTKKPDILNNRAKEKLQRIIKCINHLKNEFDREFTFSGKINKIVPNKKGKSKYFYVDKGCIRCGYCMQVCPARNIKLIGKKVEWLNNCNSCFACLHFCSQSVIQYKKLSVGKSRQHHPSVSLNDISMQRD